MSKGVLGCEREGCTPSGEATTLYLSGIDTFGGGGFQVLTPSVAIPDESGIGCPAFLLLGRKVVWYL